MLIITLQVSHLLRSFVFFITGINVHKLCKMITFEMVPGTESNTGKSNDFWALNNFIKHAISNWRSPLFALVFFFIKMAQIRRI